jgi:hypothetical protein
MAYFKSNLVKMVTQSVPDRAGEIHEVFVEYTINPNAVNTVDVVELCNLPAMSKIVECDVFTQNFAAANINLGFMSGVYGNPDGARTVGTQLLNASAANAAASVGLATLAGIAADENNDRGIGFTVSANQAAGATKKLFLRLRYTRSTN